MNRRLFLIGGSIALVSKRTIAQRAYRVGVLANGPESIWSARIAALRQGLETHGYVEGRNLNLLVRWNDGGLDKLPVVAADLLREKPDVVVCAPVLAAAAVHKASNTVPIVLANGAGLVKIGLAKSFARPGGNVTGIENNNEELTTKHLELLKVIVPRASRIGVLTAGNFLFYDEAWRAARNAEKALKIQLTEIRLSSVQDVMRLDGKCAEAGCDALYAMTDPATINWRSEIVRKVADLRIPTMYFQPDFVEVGGLISYSANIEDMFRRSASHVDRILRGAKPGDLPIERPTKFELMINLRAAKALGLRIPRDVLSRADRVIQ